MKYSVLNKLNVVYTTNNIYGSIEYVKNKHKDAIYLPTEFIDEPDNWEQELTNEKHKEGKYILSNITTTKLFSKIKKDVGFIFSNIIFEINLLDIWTLIVNPEPIILKEEEYKTKWNIKLEPIKQPEIITTKMKPEISILDIKNAPLKNSKYFCIGFNTTDAYSKIETIINTHIINSSIYEEHIYIITNTDEKIKYWIKKYPNSFVCSELDNEILYMLTPFDKTENKKLIILDNCITKDIIYKKRFAGLLHGVIPMIIMSDDEDIYTTHIPYDCNYLMIHSFPEKWNVKTSELFCKNYPILKNHKELVNSHLECMKNKNALVVNCKLPHTQILQF
jgi:hypothetical protein|uniref:Uncharacterized protein n=1 Tax=viral metagenome TaxID=1070528 RepID=A0A6C0DZ53_9ZZZZ